MTHAVKYIAAALAVVIAVTVFVSVSKNSVPETTSYLSTTAPQNVDPATQPAAPVTAAPVAPTVPGAPVTVDPAASVTAATVPGTPVAPATDASVPAADATTAPAAMSRSEQIAAMTKAINDVKAMSDFNAHKVQSINVQLTDCSLSALTSLINRILQKFISSKDVSYSFSGGKAYDSAEEKEVTVSEAIPPTNRNVTVNEAGIASFSAAASGANTVYTLVFKPETATLSNPAPAYEAGMCDYLDLGGLDISPASLTSATINYEGTTVTVTVDPNGRLLEYHTVMPLNGVGEGSAMGLSASGTIKGSLDELWTFTW